MNETKITQYIYDLDDTLEALTDNNNTFNKKHVIEFICDLKKEAILKRNIKFNDASPLRIRCNGEFKYDEAIG